ncbi:hypothetical protein L7E55_05805 [Pelotomaculum isophthalicicum JI]|uniref:Uncharacterized protein n=1 Tax=Pelotomaculum isophthalicicum JI TaxID=947010 RepID=A0A9X4H4U4_9FIRM|nr:hypothetical protein [Pelotomaculum isophthalicicum]MDF9407877.1 hypothetical protein [Pelotomaculum isophthalicicum JI]
MQAVLECLNKKQVMRNEDIFVLRDYIAKKYPDSGINERAKILANAVHKVIDRYLQEFNEKYRSQIKFNLLRRAVSKNYYGLNEDDIFKICIAIHNHEEDYTEALTKWVNNRQEIPVARETLIEFVNKVRRYAGDKLEHDWSLILEYLNSVEIEPEKRHLLSKLDLTKYISLLLERIAGVLPYVSGLLSKNKFYQAMTAFLLMSVFLTVQPLKNLPPSVPQIVVSNSAAVSKTRAHQPVTQPEILTDDLLYKEVNNSRLKQSLVNRNSILAEEPYFSVIIQSAKEFNINPIFLFAIAGQEQSLVPRQDKEAVLIANNPFNVYHSWVEYNTNIQDSARIASITISNLLWTKPEAVDPVTWINQHYCEDEQWRYGVSWFFKNLSNEVQGEG